jgi:hypothetical protein
MKKFETLLTVITGASSVTGNCRTRETTNENTFSMTEIIQKYNDKGYSVCSVSGEGKDIVLVMHKEIE